MTALITITPAAPPALHIINDKAIPLFPDFAAAYRAFERFLSQTSKTTQATYRPSMIEFANYLKKPDSSHQIPVLPIVRAFIDDQLTMITPVTVSKKMAAVRKFLTFLSEQLINPEMSDREYRYLNEMRESVRMAAAIANPPNRHDSHEAPILQHGVWMFDYQINEMLALIDRQSLIGKRDYALLITGFYTGLRRAELQKLSLAHFDTTSQKIDTIKG